MTKKGKQRGLVGREREWSWWVGSNGWMGVRCLERVAKAAGAEESGSGSGSGSHGSGGSGMYGRYRYLILNGWIQL